MMWLSLPRWVYAVIVAAGFIVGTYLYGHHAGWSERDAEMQAEIAKKDAEAREIERVMTNKLNTTSVKLQEANHAVNEKQSALTRAIRAGRVRLPAASCVPSSASSPASSGNSAEATSESERQTLEAIAAIVAEGDRAINQLNACIDAYNEVREQINGKR